MKLLKSVYVQYCIIIIIIIIILYITYSYAIYYMYIHACTRWYIQSYCTK